ncbi:MAG: helix-turn-helix domain-containing protein [Bifidobacterium aquikefiri]|uniref:ArsR family transcriptional regulator n=2 Tax=Bifidobacterium aquikefiri TaxID=1653207 RepID=A0A261G8Y5_9BIFI|nr:helix-turn-helix domain-containing protein [Bifidobacterium aquikefiri]OZG67882.1 ArsR family transcriptional regulator [Bifidobacterium aquikefiri]
MESQHDQASTSTEASTPTPEQLRALTHPIRLRLLGILRINGSATATDLARMTELNTGSTSYHLRILAKYGFIERDSELSSGRKLFWKAKQLYTTVEDPSPDSDDIENKLDAAGAFMQVAATETTRQILQAASDWRTMDTAWQKATTMSDYAMMLTPHEADDIAKEVQGILLNAMQQHPLIHHDTKRSQGSKKTEGSTTDPQRKAVEMQFHLFPIAQGLLR